MLHSISKNTDSGTSQIQISKSDNDVLISISTFNHESVFVDSFSILLNSKEYYELIGTMLFVQSQIKK